MLLLGQLLGPWDQGDPVHWCTPLSMITREKFDFFYRVVLEAVPMRLDKEAGSGSHDFPRSWMLPVMKEHIECTELAYFTQAMLPLAAQLRAKGGYIGTRLSADFHVLTQRLEISLVYRDTLRPDW